MSTVKYDAHGNPYAMHYDSPEHEYQTGKQGV